MRNEIIRELQAEYEQQRQRNQAEETRRAGEAAAACPGLEALLAERRELILDGLRRVMRGEQAAEDIPARMAEAGRRISDCLKANGFPADYLEPVCRCPVCQDRGYVGEPVREMCACMRRRLSQRLYEEAVGGAARETFAEWRAEVYSDVPDERGVSPRERMIRNRDACKAWAESYPQAAQRDVLLMGDSGLGKSFMMHAMADVLISKDADVRMLNAYQLLEAARRAYFDGDDELLREALAADVLFVDDLGSEPIMRNVTVEQFYNILNERQAAGKSTVISTNLKKKALQDAYTERVVSRLWDEQACMRVVFAGTDIRRRKEAP